MKTNEIEVIFQCTYFAKRADWDQKLQQTMVEIFPLKSADAAYSKISGMLSTLGDPFTRIISPTVCVLGLILSSEKRLLLPDLHKASMSCDKSVNDCSQEYQSFRIGSDGNVQGVGVFINKEPSSGRLVSMFLFILL